MLLKYDAELMTALSYKARLKSISSACINSHNRLRDVINLSSRVKLYRLFVLFWRLIIAGMEGYALLMNMNNPTDWTGYLHWVLCAAFIKYLGLFIYLYFCCHDLIFPSLDFEGYYWFILIFVKSYSLSDPLFF